MRLFILPILICSCFALAPHAQEVPAPPAGFKFGFGTGKAVPGWTKVTPDASYSDLPGYGFEPGSVASGIDRGGAKR